MRAVFLGFGFVSAQSKGFQTCSFAKASPKPKNPRSEWPQFFLNRSRQHTPELSSPMGLNEKNGSLILLVNTLR